MTSAELRPETIDRMIASLHPSFVHLAHAAREVETLIRINPSRNVLEMLEELGKTLSDNEKNEAEYLPAPCVKF